jgi:peptidoglycan/LPS O-acetylase OafA/YrhL
MPQAKKDMGHLAQLDVLRGFAILYVFLFHALGAVFRQDKLPWAGLFRSLDEPVSFLVMFPVTFGWSGVSLFFVISGFCIHLSYRRAAEGDWLGFAVKRLTRIYPAYLVAMLLCLFVYPWTLGDSNVTTGETISHLLLAQNFISAHFLGINPSFWSLAVEAQLYLIYPLLLLLTARLGWKTSLGVLLVVEVFLCVMAGLGLGLPSELLNSPLRYWFSWAIGAASAEAYLRGMPMPFRKFPLWLFPVLMVAVDFFQPTSYLSFTFAALTGAVVLSRMIEKERSAPVTEAKKPFFLKEMVLRHLAFLGVVSYSFYLLHQPLLLFTAKLFRTQLSGQPNVLWVIVVALSYLPILGLSWAMYRAVELPGIGLGRVILKKVRKPANAARAEAAAT